MNVEFINPFIKALLNVLTTMAQTTVTAGKPKLKNDSISKGDVSGIIGMIGPKIKGSFSISFDESLALTIMQRMLGERPDTLNEEVADMVGEITNMVTGGAKMELGEQGYEFDMATPAIVTGPSHSIVHQVSGPKLVITFTSPEGNVHLEICFDK